VSVPGKGVGADVVAQFNRTFHVNLSVGFDPSEWRHTFTARSQLKKKNIF